MKKSERRYSSSALSSAKKKVNAFNRSEGKLELKINQLLKEINGLEASNAPAFVIRVKQNNLKSLRENFNKVHKSRLNADAKYNSYLKKNKALDTIS